MTIKITFEFSKESDAAEFMARSASPVTAQTEPRPFEYTKEFLETDVTTSPIPLAVEPTAKKTRAKKEKPEVIEPTKAAATLEDVRVELGRLMARKGIDACTSLLKAHNVTRIGELDVGAYDEFIAGCSK